ncbi:hypothetical protein TYRP_016070 [Tyrophagus putrescentiae]|nr:hypothetical protein TYRP_016070 [Tyrophagus putrescentiae]
MPVFVLTTNLGADKIPSGFRRKADQCSGANALQACFLCCRGDGQTPAGNCRLSSIGSISSQQNKKSSEKIMGFIEKEIGIPSDRMYIEFVDLSPGNVGWSGSTF